MQLQFQRMKTSEKRRRKRKRVFTRDRWRCQRCWWSPPVHEREKLALNVDSARPPHRFLTVDHIIPRSHGGGNGDGNLRTYCNHCNERRGNRLT